MRRRLVSSLIATLAAACVGLIPTTPAQADQVRGDQWHLRYLKVADAHKATRGEGVTVAVLDTGVYPHPDLHGNLLPGTNILTGQGDGRQDPSTNSHGTRMAGLIAAHGSETSGALGVAPAAKILPIVTLAPNGKNEGEHDEIAKGVEWATTHGADIISVSIAGGTSARLANAVSKAIQTGIVVVAGVGNTPASYGVSSIATLPGVIAVAGTDQAGNHAAVSVTGKGITVAAPAVNIWSTDNKGGYSKGTGTSDATAIVSGAAALIRSRYPNLSAREVVHRLTATAVDKGTPGRDEEYGYGVLDLVAALTADVPPEAGASPGVTSAPSTDPTVAVGPDANAPDRGGLPLAVLGVIVMGGLVAVGAAVGVGAWAYRRTG